MEKTVVELFAGVGGFRVGLNQITTVDLVGHAIENKNFHFVWMNQWEPSTTTQDAFACYEKRFGKQSYHVNEDITLINKSDIPNHTLLVGGFPCQDYSVARSLSHEKGIEGKKGVLWWQIAEILDTKQPPFVLLENVDRLLKSPSTQRGRDFGIMLRTFFEKGYSVEWRVINAAEYGHSQRRRRVYIFAYHKSTKYSSKQTMISPSDILIHQGIYAKAFPVEKESLNISSIKIDKSAFTDLVILSNKFQFDFEHSGYMTNGIVHTTKTIPVQIAPKTLRSILQLDGVPDSCLISNSYEKFRIMKDKKRILREKNGVQYYYSEGAIAFPDSLDMPGRTMLTSEGTVNRSTHVIEDPTTNQYRLLTPIEAERLNEFPDNWTNTGMSTKKRYFMMGNALVCGVITKLGIEISRMIDNE